MKAKKVGSAMQPGDTEQSENQVGVMYYEYNFMIHYLLASLCRADGENSVTVSGVKVFDIFCWATEAKVNS